MAKLNPGDKVVTPEGKTGTIVGIYAIETGKRGRPPHVAEVAFPRRKTTEDWRPAELRSA